MLELLIVLTISTVLFSAGTLISMSAYTSFVVYAERQTLASVLERARSQALAGVHATAHGVCYVAPYYVLFEGYTCTPNDPANEKIYAAQLTAEASHFDETFPVIIFTRGTATTTPVSISLQGAAVVQDIIVNEEGTIAW